MTEQEVLEAVKLVGACITDSHIVYTSDDKHGTDYFNKDAIYPHTMLTSMLCRALAKKFADDDVEVVVAPAIGGVALSQEVARHLTELTGREVLAVYAEKGEEVLFVHSPGEQRRVSLVEKKYTYEYGFVETGAKDVVELYLGDQLIKKSALFEFKRGQDKLIAGKRVLVVEDVLNTGGSAAKVVSATRVFCYGKVVGVGALCNRGGVTPKDLGSVPKLEALVNIKLDAWDEKECARIGPCSKQIPVNTEVGKGREFLARRLGR